MTVATETMTSRERWLAALDMKPIDRLPFWPKIDGSYAQHQTAEFQGINLHDWIGSDKHVHCPPPFRESHSECSCTSENEGKLRRTLFQVGNRTLESVYQHDQDSSSWHPTVFPISTRDDVLAMAKFFRDTTVELSPENIERAKEVCSNVGENGVIVDGIGESPLMRFVEHLAGVENAHFLLADCRDDVEELFDAMHQDLLRRAEIAAEHSQADATYLVENTSTTLISPAQYARYCFKHITDYGNAMQGGGKRVILHMCGHLKGLLDQLNNVPANAFEAFTSPTLGNTSFLDGRTGCPEKCLVGGTNAMLWLKSADKIIAKIKQDLDELPHHRGIVVTSAGVMPPFCRPETIREVCEFVKQYPVRL
jgi:uroporphyrinogen-III decarboxylase